MARGTSRSSCGLRKLAKRFLAATWAFCLLGCGHLEKDLNDFSDSMISALIITFENCLKKNGLSESAAQKVKGELYVMVRIENYLGISIDVRSRFIPAEPQEHLPAIEKCSKRPDDPEKITEKDRPYIRVSSLRPKHVTLVDASGEEERLPFHFNPAILEEMESARKAKTE